MPYLNTTQTGNMPIVFKCKYTLTSSQETFKRYST